MRMPDGDQIPAGEGSLEAEHTPNREQTPEGEHTAKWELSPHPDDDRKPGSETDQIPVPAAGWRAKVRETSGAAGHRTPALRGWFQSSGRLRPGEANGAPDEKRVRTKGHGPGRPPAIPREAPADAETVILPKLGTTRPKAQNGSAAVGTEHPSAARISGVGLREPGEVAHAPADSSPTVDQERTPGPVPAGRDRALFRGWFPPRRHQERQADANGDGNGQPERASKRGGFLGLAPAVRPDVLTDAETVILPMVGDSRLRLLNGSTRSSTAPPPTAKAGTVGLRQPGKAVPAPAAMAIAEAPTQILPVQSAPQPQTRVADEPQERYTPSRRVKRISRLILFAILCLQAGLSLRLRNTAFEDEALYLYSGHMELEHLLHGSALQGNYAAIFSGSPVLYPVAAAVLDQVGGLALARALSLVEMLAITTMLYSIARYLFNERVGLYAAALYAVVESTIFLGNFATYDATCLCLLAFAAWIMVYTSRCRWPVFLLAAPLAALAVGVKYAGALFLPTIAVLPPLAAWPGGRRRVLLHPLGFLVVVAEFLFVGLHVGGHSYLTAIESTTTNRAQGLTSDLTILRETAEWGGVVILMAVVGTVAYVRRVRTEPEEDIAPAGGRLRRAMLGVVLTGTAFLAPAYQAHLHTDTSFLKHIGFGLFFAAPMAGFGLARLVGDYFRRPHVGIAIWSLALVLGMGQSGQLYHVWPASGPFVSAFSSYLKPHAKYLVEVPEVPIYYLMGNPDAQPDQFTSTFFIVYYNDKGQQLTGPAGYTAAVDAGYFQVIAISGDVTPGIDGVLTTALEASHSYYLADTVYLGDAFGPLDYFIWVKGQRPSIDSSANKDGHFLLPS
jgi:Dolichyl-phosphate-mannose-protein mannosyltransferase